MPESSIGHGDADNKGRRSILQSAREFQHRFQPALGMIAQRQFAAVRTGDDGVTAVTADGTRLVILPIALILLTVAGLGVGVWVIRRRQWSVVHGHSSMVGR